ncbi:MAG: CDP-diacylglycerol--glycerol-3-phosphate 3-phosphatidyltransferase [Alphaproteobacteria bacterium]|nr:CDP-diacylglycerol--glycerol-3-phosphate 3-phosphatidyltransferase [Alphaproteobacteria bacterium]
MNAPNALTLARVAAVPAIVLLLFADDPVAGIAPAWLATALFALAAATDWVDGWLARRTGAVSAFGRLLDPVADKVLVAGVLVGLVATGIVGGWHVAAAIVILGRELLVSGLREYLAQAGGELPVTRLAKWKTAGQLVAIVALAASPAAGPLAATAGLALLWLAAVLTAVTGWSYLAESLRRVEATPRPGGAAD